MAKKVTKKTTTKTVKKVAAKKTLRKTDKRSVKNAPKKLKHAPEIFKTAYDQMLEARVAEEKALMEKHGVDTFGKAKFLEDVAEVVELVKSGRAKAIVSLEVDGVTPLEKTFQKAFSWNATPEMTARTCFGLLDDSALVSNHFKKLALVDLFGN